MADPIVRAHLPHEQRQANPTIRLVSADSAENDWLAVNQVKVVDRDHDRRFDLVLYCNNLPVIVIELKKAGNL